MHIRSLEIQSWTLPLRAPFVISQRTAHDAPNIIVILRAGNARSDVTGYGACAPAAYVTGETPATVVAAIESARGSLLGAPVDSLDSILTAISALLPSSPAARACLEIAAYDLWARHHQISLWHHFGARRVEIRTDITIPISSPEECGRLAAAAVDEGFMALKIKVGGPAGVEADLQRLKAVADAAPGVSVRIDANQAFSPSDAVSFARRLRDLNILVDLIEQPVPKDDFAGLQHVKDNIDYPIFADEAACTVESVSSLIALNAVDGINVKLMKSGIRGALQIVALCQAAGKDLMIGCMLETPLGIAAAAQIAGGTGAFRYIDLDAHLLLAPVGAMTGGFAASGDRLVVAGPSAEPYGWGVKIVNSEEPPSGGA